MTDSPPTPRTWSQRAALLVTDLVDSTALAESLGLEAAAALGARHDRIARDLLAAHGGREIDKADGFLLLFDEPGQAVAFALDYHPALEAMGLRARAGLHAGDVVLRENAAHDVARGAKPLEVEGVVKALAARVMSVAPAGRTLATAESVASLGLLPPSSTADGPCAVVAHGHWQLKGLPNPIEVVEIGSPRIGALLPPSDAPKAWRVVWSNDLWLPARSVRHGLPSEQDRFVGREADLLGLGSRLEEARLVSVLGIGGTGKTRLAIRFGWTRLGEYPGGVWFCDLSEVRGVDGICGAVAGTLGLPPSRSEPVTRVGDAIAGRGRCLVVLDNFEQITAFAAETLGVWLGRAPEASFVATSREVLGLPGEQVLALAPLVDDDAVELFVARARAGGRDLADDDRPSIRRLATLLDGLPLAIELAAARARVMPPNVLLQRMTERFRLLASTGGRPPRHQTLRATLDWSWDLLPPDEQLALAQLSVFEGGFALDAAEAVLELPKAWPVDAVQALVDKSLVRRVADDRFDLLLTVHEYAALRLDELGLREATEARHGAWFAAFANRYGQEGSGTTESDRKTLHRDFDNLLATLRRAVARHDAATALPTLRAAAILVIRRGPVAPVMALGQAIRGFPSLSELDAARTDVVLAVLMHLVGEGRAAAPRCERAIGVFSAHGELREEANARSHFSSIVAELGRFDDAIASSERALRLCIAGGWPRGECVERERLGALLVQTGRADEARPHLDRGLALARELDDQRREALIHGDLSMADQYAGRLAEAEAHTRLALGMTRSIGDRRNEGAHLTTLGGIAHERGRLEEAIAYQEEALALYRELGDRMRGALSMGNLGSLHLALGRTDLARAALTEALTVQEEVGFQLSAACCLADLALLERAGGNLDLAGSYAARAVAAAGPYANALPVVLVVAARVALARSDTPTARDLMTRARALADRRAHQALTDGLEALVLLGEGARADAEAALERATADPEHLTRGGQLVELVAEARAALAAR